MITKRGLGLDCMFLGAGLLAAVLLADLLGAGDFEGFGPLQWMALIPAGLLFLIGLTLLPLGDRPA
ncbi:MAG: hypothetical protein ACRDHL_11540 [Candidatus Promineifilaceae bacterium]